MAYRGRYVVKNPHKYKGDPSNVIYRSLWERKLCKYLDSHDDIIEWSSEEVVIPYRSPIDNRVHRYFVDFYVKKRLPDGKTQTVLIEVKPKKQTLPPDPAKKNATPTGRMSRRYLNEVRTWGVNQAKWKAASEFCADRGWIFQIMTEKELGV